MVRFIMSQTACCYLFLSIQIHLATSQTDVRHVFLPHDLAEGAMVVLESFPTAVLLTCMNRVLSQKQIFNAFRMRSGTCELGHLISLGALQMLGTATTYLPQVWTPHLKLFVGISTTRDLSGAACAYLNGTLPEPRANSNIRAELTSLEKYDTRGGPWVGLADPLMDGSLLVWISDNITLGTAAQIMELTDPKGGCYHFIYENGGTLGEVNCNNDDIASFACQF